MYAGLFRTFVHATDRRLDVVGGIDRVDGETLSSARQFRPLSPPVIRAQFLTRDESICGKLKTNAILRVRTALAVSMAPLPNLGGAFHLETEVDHAIAQLRNRHGTGRGKVLVEIHSASLVAIATTSKEQML